MTHVLVLETLAQGSGRGQWSPRGLLSVHSGAATVTQKQLNPAKHTGPLQNRADLMSPLKQQEFKAIRASIFGSSTQVGPEPTTVLVTARTQLCWLVLQGLYKLPVECRDWRQNFRNLHYKCFVLLIH